jgi:hypothetical protein
MLVINCFFGRTGPGGPDGCYHPIETEVDKWLGDCGIEPLTNPGPG